MYRRMFHTIIYLLNGLLLCACPSFNDDNNAESKPQMLIEITSCRLNCRIESGYIFGTAALQSKSDLFSVRASIDGGPSKTIQGTSTWKLQIPSGANTKGLWYFGSKHTIEISTVNSDGVIVESREFELIKGHNKDFNGDGFPDLAISAPNSDISGTTDGGAIYIYNGTATGINNSQYNNRLHYPATDVAPAFGNTLPYIGDVNGDGYGDLAVGAAFSDIAGIDQGAVIIYHGSAQGLSNGTGDASNSDAKNGRAYDQLLQYEGTDNGAYLGYFVASAGDVNKDGFDDLLATAAYADHDPTATQITDQGIAYVYYGSAAGLSGGTGDQRNTDGSNGKKYDQRLIYPGNDAKARFGESASGAGDINGDGYSDIVISAPFSDINQTDNGAAFVYFGSSNGLSNGTGDPANTDGNNGTLYDQRILYSGPDIESRFGYSFTFGLDINGDGFGDLVLSAKNSDLIGNNKLATNRGAAYVYFGSQMGLTGGTGDRANTDGSNGKLYNQRLLYPELDDAAFFGFGISYGYINADNFADIVIGAAKSSFSATNTGIVYTYLGSALGVSNGSGNPTNIDVTDGKSYQSRLQYPSDDSDVNYGVIMPAGTDFNLDGYTDLLISAYYSNLDGENQGTVFMYNGNEQGVLGGSDQKKYDYRLSYPESDQAAVFGRFISW